MYSLFVYLSIMHFNSQLQVTAQSFLKLYMTCMDSIIAFNVHV